MNKNFEKLQSMKTKQNVKKKHFEEWKVLTNDIDSVYFRTEMEKSGRNPNGEL